MGGDNMRKLSRNTFEYLFGAEYQLTDKFLVSAGIQFTNFGINDNYTSDLAFTNDSFMTGVGGKYSLTDKVDVNFVTAKSQPHNSSSCHTASTRSSVRAMAASSIPSPGSTPRHISIDG